MSASPKLRLFGGFSLSDASGEVAGLTLRKTEALIAFLAAGTSHSQPREVLANLLWSESTQAGALQSLRQARLTLTRNLAAHGLAFVQFSRREVVLDDSAVRSEEHTSELQSLMRISYAVFCLNKKRPHNNCPHTP